MALRFIAAFFLVLITIDSAQRGNYPLCVVTAIFILLGIIEYSNATILRTIYYSKQKQDHFGLLKFILFPWIMEKINKEWFWDYMGTKHYFEDRYDLAIAYLGKCLNTENYSMSDTSNIFYIKSKIALGKFDEAANLINKFEIKTRNQKEETMKWIKSVEDKIEEIKNSLDNNKNING